MSRSIDTFAAYYPLPVHTGHGLKFVITKEQTVFGCNCVGQMIYKQTTSYVVEEGGKEMSVMFKDTL